MENKSEGLSIKKLWLWVLAFAVSYTQYPLYSSNQNTYFLKGLAEAGVGFLKEDWMIKTTDPFPLFTYLVNFTCRYFHEHLFYLYYIILLSVYIYGLLGIVSIIFDVDKEKSKFLTIILVLTALHSKVVGFISQKIFAVDLSWFLQSGVAKQHILGPVFQPSTFAVFIILSIYFFLRKRQSLSLFSLALAVYFHPSPNYILSGVVLSLSYIYILCLEKKALAKVFAFGILAFILILPAIIFLYQSFGPTSPEIWRKSQQILVKFRLPQHADYQLWLNAECLIKILLISIALYLARKTRLFYVMLFPFVVMLVLTVVQVFFKSLTLALFFPWRISVFLVPVSVGIIIADIISILWQSFSRQISGKASLLLKINTISMVLLVLGGICAMKYKFDYYSSQPSVAVMDYIKKAKLKEEIYLVPPELEDFRLYVGVPIFVDYKTHPYKDIEVVEWYNRIQLVDRFYFDKNARGKLAEKLINDYAITHILVKNSQVNGTFDNFREVYKDKNYILYKCVKGV